MSVISSVFTLSLLAGALAASQPFPNAPIDMALRPLVAPGQLARRQVAAAGTEGPLQLGKSGWTTQVRIGPGVFNLVVSTQDADTWVVSDRVKCTNPPDAPANIPQPPCKFGNKFPSAQFQKYSQGPQQPVLSSQAGAGQVGYAPLSVAGINIPNQVFGLVDDTIGTDETVSGTLGLGTATQSDIGWRDNKTSLVYNNVIANIIASRLVSSPVFSLTLAGNGGALAIGGVPRSANIDGGSWASAPFISDFYGVAADGYVVDGQGSRTPLKALLDIRSPGSFFPKAVADAINAKIPGSKFNPQTGLYAIACSGNPSLSAGVIIGGKPFTFKGADLVTKDPNVPGACISTVGASRSTDEAVLGENFFKATVTVFEPTAKKISFAKRN